MRILNSENEIRLRFIMLSLAASKKLISKGFNSGLIALRLHNEQGISNVEVVCILRSIFLVPCSILYFIIY